MSPSKRKTPCLLLRAAGALLAAALHLPAAALEDVPFVRTPAPVVDAILELAEVGPDDRLVDLGSGDGRIVIAAARRFGTHGLGVEIVPRLVEQARLDAAAAGAADRTRFLTQDLFDTDLSGASVVTLYLLPDVNLALRPRLLETLAPGARVVSHDWDMGDWRPDRSVTVPAPDKPVGPLQQSTLHLWVIPARIAGGWRMETTDGADRAQALSLNFRQRFQDFSVAVQATPDRRAPAGESAAPLRVDGAKTAADGAVSAVSADGAGSLAGRRLWFEVALDGRTLRFNGLVDGDRMAGQLNDGTSVRPWSAAREPAR
ncbi:SAM-dependent methyltransferase [Quisquiliibacterium transsilvanicum]|uniref:SAM-dependent methyltransferase n=1 Tax=Quisquiliibacterium transsilvanicum TaxID=1549638 RepID=A0A7W8HJH7_9BURK|nr:class I SAM-dependent methyltransferase [Quisquiliibacterium transsilvanicum]MBB5272571.1 SAM-dependent methyltransferase [Quisquiliibacterium transsilvanicum]